MVDMVILATIAIGQGSFDERWDVNIALAVIINIYKIANHNAGEVLYTCK